MPPESSAIDIVKENAVFQYRPYGKTELAVRYAQGQMQPRAALNWFNHEIAQYPGLLERLRALGYRPGTRILTIAQVRAITAAIGEP